MHNALARRINAYFATLLITVLGAGASLLIIHIANSPTAPLIVVKQNVDATKLQQSILGQ